MVKFSPQKQYLVIFGKTKIINWYRGHAWQDIRHIAWLRLGHMLFPRPFYILCHFYLSFKLSTSINYLRIKVSYWQIDFTCRKIEWTRYIIVWWKGPKRIGNVKKGGPSSDIHRGGTFSGTGAISRTVAKICGCLLSVKWLVFH